MKYFQDILSVTVKAATLFDAGDLVGFGGARLAADDAPVLGVARHPATEIGQDIAVIAIGLAQPLAAEAITAGQRVVSAASGGVRPAGSGAVNVIGTALIDAAPGQRVTILMRDAGRVAPAAAVVFTAFEVGDVAMQITVPQGATLTGRTATFTPVGGSPAAIVLGGALDAPTWTAEAAGTIALTVQWTDAQGQARTTTVSQVIRHAVPTVTFSPSAPATGQTVNVSLNSPGASTFVFWLNGIVVPGSGATRSFTAGAEGEHHYAAVAIGPGSASDETTGTLDVAAATATAPAAIPASDWSIAAGDDPGEIVITLASTFSAISLPLHYRVAGGPAYVVSSTPTPGESYTLTGGTTAGATQAVQLSSLQAGVYSWGTARNVAVPGAVSAPNFYPNVAPVDLTAGAGSFKFPEGNWNEHSARAGLTANKGLLAQTRAGFTRPGAGTPHAFAMIVRLPVDKRDGGTYYGLFGSGATGSHHFGIRLGQRSASNTAHRRCFIHNRQGASGVIALTTPVWDEDSALIVVWHDGIDQFGFDWYSLADGSRHAGTPLTYAALTAGAGSAVLNIGGCNGTSVLSANVNGGTALWPGEIGEIWNIVGTNPTPAQWAQVALGADLRDFVPVGNINYARKLDGTDASLAKPAWASADTTAPATRNADTSPLAGGTTLLPGSTLRRQSLAGYVTLDECSPGQVYGLMRGERRRSVPFSGRSSGPVQVRVYDAVDGRVVVDWTPMDIYASGAWTGSIVLPESERGWVLADVRLVSDPSVIWHGRSEFGVGFKYMIIGQSQMQIPMDLTTTRLTIAAGAAMSGSVARLLKNANRPAGLAREPLMSRIGAGHQAGGDGFVAFLNQFRKLKPRTPVMLYHEAIGGTDFTTIIAGNVDTSTDRQWADLQDKLDRWGNDVTAVLFNWLISQSGGDDLVTEYLEDAFLPAHAGHKANSFVTALQPGWSLVSMPSDRRSDATGYTRSVRRASRTAFINQYAASQRFYHGPNVCDYRIEDAGGGHPADSFNTGASSYCPPEVFDQGGARMMSRTAVGALVAINELPQHAVLPHFANARLSPDRTQIWVDVIATNGGRIYSPAPTALRSWMVYEPGDSGASPFSLTSLPGIPTVTKGYSTALNTAVTPPRVEITRSTGTFAYGTYAYRIDDGEKRPSGSTNGYLEDEIHAGGIYESWHDDALAGIPGYPGGIPVCGTIGPEGRWINRFEDAPPAPIEVPIGGLATAIASATGGEVFRLAAGAHPGITLTSRQFVDPIRITGPGSLGNVLLKGCRGVEFVDVSVAMVETTGQDGYRSNNLVFHNVSTGAIQLNYSDLVRASHVDIAQTQPLGFVLMHSTWSILLNSTIRNWLLDAIRVIGASYDNVLETLHIRDFSPPTVHHHDHLQIYGADGANPKRLWLRHSLLMGHAMPRTVIASYPPPPPGNSWVSQGILTTDSEEPGVGWQDMFFEWNVFAQDTSEVMGGGGMRGTSRVRHNTAILPYQVDDPTRISRFSLASGTDSLLVEKNIVGTISSSGTNMTIRENVLYGLVSPFPPQTNDPTCAIPTVGSGIPDEMGATKWLRDRFVV